MKKIGLFLVVGLLASSLSMAVNANDIKQRAIGFFAPEVTSTGSIPNPEIGAIVLESTHEGKTFKGFDGTDWTAFSGPVGGFVPVASVVPFAGTSAPDGYLMADGSAVSRTTYAALFDAIGTTYGAGDGSTTFNLPNLQGVFVRGAGSQTISGISYSGTLAAKEADQFQGHAHNISDPGHAHTQTFAPTGGGLQGIAGVGGATQANSQYTTAGAFTGITVTNPSSDGVSGTPRTGSETRPASITLNYIIKY